MSLQGLADGLDLVVVLNIDDQAGDKGTQNLSDNVSDRLQRRESLEKSSRNGNSRAKVSSRHGGTDGNGEDDSYAIGKANTKQGCIKRVSE